MNFLFVIFINKKSKEFFCLQFFVDEDDVEITSSFWINS